VDLTEYAPLDHWAHTLDHLAAKGTA